MPRTDLVINLTWPQRNSFTLDCIGWGVCLGVGCLPRGRRDLHPGGLGRPPLPPPSDTTGYGQQAGGTHPTGMHSCFIIRSLNFAFC